MSTSRPCLRKMFFSIAYSITVFAAKAEAVQTLSLIGLSLLVAPSVTAEARGGGLVHENMPAARKNGASLVMIHFERRIFLMAFGVSSTRSVAPACSTTP